MICGINECVGSQKSFVDIQCPYSHVNFFANPKTGGGLKLFFAELSNGDDDRSFCCTVPNKSIHGKAAHMFDIIVFDMIVFDITDPS